MPFSMASEAYRVTAPVARVDKTHVMMPVSTAAPMKAPMYPKSLAGSTTSHAKPNGSQIAGIQIMREIIALSSPLTMAAARKGR